jgi:hypothetical protein
MRQSSIPVIELRRSDKRIIAAVSILVAGAADGNSESIATRRAGKDDVRLCSGNRSGEWSEE